VNGKDYVIEAIALTEKLLAEIKTFGLLEGEPLLESAAKACENLAPMKTKATLRTRAGTNLAFPVYDAAQNLEEAWEEAQESNSPDELKENMEDFTNRAEELIAALKERTFIMT
jgi:hypothetical protein